MRMPLLDRLFYLLDSIHSPQDFTLILHLNNSPDVDSFYAGARSAMNRFPTSASCIQRRSWVWQENKYFKLEIVSTGSDCGSKSTSERLVDEPFDLQRQPPVKQALILNDSGGARLVTRFHHAVADGLSAVMWLGHQLNVAYGLEAVQTERAPFVDLHLRHLPTSVRRSQFAFDTASDPLWTQRSNRSGSRRWLTIDFCARGLQRACKQAGGFTYNDLLATCLLEVFSRWNSQHGEAHRKVSLWMPMNVRSGSKAGFGNGTSRIRLYARYKGIGSFVEKCREIRRQVSWNSKHGEWVVPEISWITRLPDQVIGPLLRGYLDLPSVDMATAVFSHLSSGMANVSEAFKHVVRIECAGLLHLRQSLAINAATCHGMTWMSFTYDPALLSVDDIRQLSQMYEQQIALARAELL